MIESISALQNRELDERKLGLAGAKRHPDQYVQNSVLRFSAAAGRKPYALGGEQFDSSYLENGLGPRAHGSAGQLLGS